MNMRLGGWLRLWIVLAVIYGCVVVAFTVMTWPKPEQVRHQVSLIEKMSPDAREILSRPLPISITELEAALVDARNRGADEEVRSLDIHIDAKRKRLEQLDDDEYLNETTNIILTMANGHKFVVAGNTTREDAKIVGSEYSRVLRYEVHKPRRITMRNSLLFWSVPTIIVLVLGGAVGWIYRGFTTEN